MKHQEKLRLAKTYLKQMGAKQASDKHPMVKMVHSLGDFIDNYKGFKGQSYAKYIGNGAMAVVMEPKKPNGRVWKVFIATDSLGSLLFLRGLKSGKYKSRFFPKIYSVKFFEHKIRKHESNVYKKDYLFVIVETEKLYDLSDMLVYCSGRGKSFNYIENSVTRICDYSESCDSYEDYLKSSRVISSLFKRMEKTLRHHKAPYQWDFHCGNTMLRKTKTKKGKKIQKQEVIVDPIY